MRFTRPQARKTTEGHGVLLPARSLPPPSLHPPVCFLFCFVLCVYFLFFPETVALQTSHSLTSPFSKRGPLKLMIMLWAGTTLWRPNSEPLVGPDGEWSQEREEGAKVAAKNSGTVWKYYVTSSLFSLCAHILPSIRLTRHRCLVSALASSLWTRWH